MSNIPPSSSAPQGVPHFHGDDPIGDALWEQLQHTILSSPACKALCAGIVDALNKDPDFDPNSPQSGIIENKINEMVTQKYGNHDVYQEYFLTDGDLEGFATIMQTYSGGWSPTLPDNYTAADRACAQVYGWLTDFFHPAPSDVQDLGSDFLRDVVKNVGSWGDMTEVDAQLTHLVFSPDFFTKYPMLTHLQCGDLNTLAQYANCQLPDFTRNYLTAYYLMVKPFDPHSDECRLGNDLLSEMRTAASSGQSLKDVQKWAFDILKDGFAGYPALLVQGARDLENILGMPQPPLQDQLFAVRQWIGDIASGTPAVQMAKQFLEQLKNFLPSGSKEDLKTWYEGAYQKFDPFMQFPQVDKGNIQMMSQIATDGTLYMKATPIDDIYRTVVGFLSQVDPKSGDCKLLRDLADHWKALGSLATDYTTVYTWAKSIIATTPPFTAYSPIEKETVTRFLSVFDYSVTLSYFRSFMMMWPGAGAPESEQVFAKSMLTILNGYARVDPHPSLERFQQYLNANYSKIDFCFQCYGLSPITIDTLFKDMGVESPYHYQPVDFAYAYANGALLLAQNPLDHSILEQLVNQIVASHNDPVKHPYQGIIDWIDQLADWNKLQPQTQHELEVVVRLLKSQKT